MTGSANAASLSYTTSTPLTQTNFSNKTMSIQKFDSAIGTLNSVEIDFTGNLAGQAGFENTDTSNPANVAAELTAKVTLQLNNQSLSQLTLNPDSTSNYTVGTYDGTTDYSGISGETVDGLTANDSKTQTINDPTLLKSFIGTDNLDFLVSAKAQSNVTGSGNIYSFFHTTAATDLTVTYNYDATPPVKAPEPSALLGVGLVAGFGLLSQRKRTFSKA